MTVTLIIAIILIFKINVIAYLPWLIILACPLLHFFMMKDMHGHNKNNRNVSGKDDEDHNGKDRKSCH